MASRARLSQDRSRQRREALLAAAIELFAAGGSRAVTHRAVSKGAGLPPATTTYYFESIDDLISEALSSHVVSWVRTLGEFADTPIDVDIKLEDASALIITIFSIRPPEVVAAQLSIYLAASRDQQLRDKAGQALTSLEQIAATLLEHLGISDPKTLSQSIVAAIIGSAVRRLSQREDDQAEAALLYSMIRSLVAAESMGEAQVDAALQALAKQQVKVDD